MIFFRSHRWHVSVLHASRQADLPHAGLHGWPEKDLRPQSPGQLVCITEHTHTTLIAFSSLASTAVLQPACVFTRYPEARAIERKVIFHAGPTNSGKTYQAIQRYLAAKSGVYCGPLKLLAHEIFEKSNNAVSVLLWLHDRVGASYVWTKTCKMIFACFLLRIFVVSYISKQIVNAESSYLVSHFIYLLTSIVFCFFIWPLRASHVTWLLERRGPS